jgi:hypothetical protein
MLDSEDALQIAVHKMLRFSSKLGLNISTCRTKTMVFKGRDPVSIDIVINDTITEK